MIVQRLDAVIIFEKWNEEKTRIRCQGSFTTHAFAIEGKIELASYDQIQLIAETPLVQIVVNLNDSLMFSYADSREVTGKEAINYKCCLTIGFGEVPKQGPIDTIAFVEINPERPY